MKVNVTLQQLKKIRLLNDDNFAVLEEMVRKHGISEISKADITRLSGLRGAKLLKIKGTKAWLPFEVNGVKCTPFFGHKVKATTSSGAIAKAFYKIFKITHGAYYGDFDKRDWVTCNRMAKEFDIDELKIMLRFYMQSTAYGKITLSDFYRNRNKIFRKIGVNYEQEQEQERSDSETGGW